MIVGLVRDRIRGQKLHAYAGCEDRREIEKRRQHSDDGAGHFVQCDCTTDDRRIRREAGLPKAKREDDGRWASPRSLLDIEAPAMGRLDAQNREEVVGDFEAYQPGGLARPGKCVGSLFRKGVVASKPFERGRPLAKVAEVARTGCYVRK